MQSTTSYFCSINYKIVRLYFTQEEKLTHILHDDDDDNDDYDDTNGSYTTIIIIMLQYDNTSLSLS